MIYTNPFRNSIPPSIAESDLGNENNLIRQWRQLKPGTVLKDRNGHSILIIFRGRSNHHEGPDYLNGVIFCEGRIIQGDIELHVKENDWKSHGHLFDHRYKNVMLHVVRQLSVEPVTDIITLILQGNSSKCELPGISLTETAMQHIFRMSIHRWDRKIALFRRNENWRNIYYPESLASLGTDGNKQQWRRLGRQLDWDYAQDRQIEEWVKNFLSKACTFHWHKRGVRPVRHPNLLFNKAASWLYDLNQLTQKELFDLNQLSRVEKLFRRTELGQGTWVEWCGNVHFPAGAMYSLSRKDEQYEDWLKLWLELRLPYSCGRFQKQFQKILSPKTLRSFPVLQGLIEMENHFCNHLLCQFCLLKRDI